MELRVLDSNLNVDKAVLNFSLSFHFVCQFLHTKRGSILLLDFSSVLFQFEFQWNSLILLARCVCVYSHCISQLCAENPSDARIQIGKLEISRTRQIYVKIFAVRSAHHLTI